MRIKSEHSDAEKTAIEKVYQNRSQKVELSKTHRKLRCRSIRASQKFKFQFTLGQIVAVYFKETVNCVCKAMNAVL